jgi:hypothetical protein
MGKRGFLKPLLLARIQHHEGEQEGKVKDGGQQELAGAAPGGGD